MAQSLVFWSLGIRSNFGSSVHSILAYTYHRPVVMSAQADADYTDFADVVFGEFVGESGSVNVGSNVEPNWVTVPSSNRKAFWQTQEGAQSHRSLRKKLAAAAKEMHKEGDTFQEFFFFEDSKVVTYVVHGLKNYEQGQEAPDSTESGSEE